ncbi:MAG: 3-phosphoglycerate dehydrogenase, partial [Clostridia bacterium]|nr:3-phosphoglycerate dehydrogenase [Clostridia bacterium]
SVLAVARAGAGVNNIPLDDFAKRGVVVFNTPGANANAVKELVLLALLMGGRKITEGIDWVKTLKGKGKDVGPAVEKGKSAFVGGEIKGKTLGVVGLGAIGRLVANDCIELGMDVMGYDPYISVDAAWRIQRSVKRVDVLSELYENADYITLHLPYTASTKGMIDREAFAQMKDGAVLVNCSRGELVDNEALLEALSSGNISRYITDFPCDELIGAENVICIPHLGASTPEAEDNCAYAAAGSLVDYIENGNIRNSVNFPACVMPRSNDVRLCILHLNIKDMITRFSGAVSAKGLNIDHFINSSHGEYAYSMLDIDGDPGDDILETVNAIEGVIRSRIIR